MRATATAPRVATARARRDRATRATGRRTRVRTATAPRARLGARSSASAVETLRFLTPEDARDVAETHGTPTYVYDRATLDAQAARARAFPNAYGLTVRYAMKASPNAAILKTFKKAGLHVDASSGYECERAMKAGFEGGEISLTRQVVC